MSLVWQDYQSDGAMIVWPYKWIRGFQLGMAFWTSENHPNNTDPWNTCKHPPIDGRQPQECPPPGYVDGWPFIACLPEPCLFNIEVRWFREEHQSAASLEWACALASLVEMLKGLLPNRLNYKLSDLVLWCGVCLLALAGGSYRACEPAGRGWQPSAPTHCRLYQGTH